jgi:hypothetical protein
MPRDPATKAQQNEEKQVLGQALKAFEETTLTAAVATVDLRLPQGIADAEVQLGEGRPLVAEVKRNLTPTTLGQALAQLRRFNRPGLLVARYVTPQMAEQLKAMDVAFLDTAGNAYVRTPKMFIYITGRKPVGPAPADRPMRAFRATGLKVVFALLCRPELVAAVLEVAWMVTGAAGRLLLLERVYGLPSGRATEDVDFGVMVESWAQYQALVQRICQDPRVRQDPKQRQRLRFSEVGYLDLVPFGGVESTAYVAQT